VSKLKVDKVEHDTETYLSGEPIFEAYLKTVTFNEKPYHQKLSERPAEVFYSSLTKIWNGYCKLRSMPDISVDFEDQASVRQALLVLKFDEPIIWQEQDHLKFSNIVSFRYAGKRFYISESGWMGIGPSDIQPGDYVCVLKGGLVPSVLRDIDTDSKIACLPAAETVQKAKTVNTDPVFEDIFSSDIGEFLEARPQKVIDFINDEAASGEKPNQPRFSLIGPTYIHGLSDGEALVHIKHLYSKDYLWDIGSGWEKIFLE